MTTSRIALPPARGPSPGRGLVTVAKRPRVFSREALTISLIRTILRGTKRRDFTFVVLQGGSCGPGSEADVAVPDR
jgi:hypothetical protein